MTQTHNKIFAERDAEIVETKANQFLATLSSDQIVEIKRSERVEKGLPNLFYVVNIKYTQPQ